MILDGIDNFKNYVSVNPYFAKVSDFLQKILQKVFTFAVFTFILGSDIIYGRI